MSDIAGISGPQKADNSEHTPGAMAVPIVGVRQDDYGYPSNDGEYQPFILDSQGNLKVHVKELADVFLSLRSTLNYMTRPIWMRSSTGALRFTPETSAGVADTLSTITTVGTVTTVTTVTTLTTCSTVTSLNQLGTFPIKQAFLDTNELQLWQSSTRNRIS